MVCDELRCWVTKRFSVATFGPKLLETFFIATLVFLINQIMASLRCADELPRDSVGDFCPTFGAAGPPQTRVGQHLLVLADRLVVVLALGAAHPAGVEPVVGAHGDGHEAEGAESPRRGQQHHGAPVAQPHVSSCEVHTLLLLLLLSFVPRCVISARSMLPPGENLVHILDFTLSV